MTSSRSIIANSCSSLNTYNNILNSLLSFQFAQLVVRAQLTRLYESPTSLTLFAFNDTAYNNLPYKERNVIDSYSENDLKDYIKFCTSTYLIIVTLKFILEWVQAKVVMKRRS